MHSIKDTTIKLTKGDSFYAQVGMKRNGEIYTPQEGDVIRFMMKQTYSSPKKLIEKIIPNDTSILYLAPEDTKKLTVGNYVYDVEMTFANGDVDTFIQGKLILTPEV